MAKKSKPARGRPAADKPMFVVGVRMTEAHIAALDARAARNHRTRSAEIIVAVEASLAAEGLWPPPPAK